MAVLPVATDKAVAVLNLTSDRRITATFEEHAPAVMLLLKRVSDADVWADLLAGEVDDDTVDSYTFAYCYLLLAETVELLNLKTLGEGIIKTTGIDTQQTELLTGSEVQAFRKHLTIKALETIEDFLNADGYSRLRELALGTSRHRVSRTKASVI